MLSRLLLHWWLEVLPCDQEDPMDYKNATNTLHPLHAAVKIGGLNKKQQDIKQEKNKDPIAEHALDNNSAKSRKCKKCDNEIIRNKLNGKKSTPIDIDCVDQKVDGNDDKENVLQKNILLGSHLMEIMINNLKKHTTDNCFIATPYAFSYANSSNIAWHHVLNFCASHDLSKDTNGIFLFPTFTGQLTFGHWHLTVLKKQDVGTYGYIIDSLGINNERIKYSKETCKKIEIEVNQWKFIPSISQIGLECGPRVVTRIYDIIDHLKDKIP